MFDRLRARIASPKQEEATAIVLGDVILTTGALVLVDFGLFEYWSHANEPQIFFPDPELTLRASSCVDLEIVGPDATAVASMINPDGVERTYVFDMAPEQVVTIEATVAEICAKEGLSATVEMIPRMPHGERARRLLSQHPDGVEVQFHGPWAIAIAIAIAIDDLRLVGRYPSLESRCPTIRQAQPVGDQFGWRWHQVTLCTGR